MPGIQRIFVVSATAPAAELARLRKDLRRDPLVLTAPTAEAQLVVGPLGVTPRVELVLAPVRFPTFDRGHRLDDLVRQHAVRDRFRDVVVVCDTATSTLLLRVMAADQLSTAGGVTVVGLAREDRPMHARRALVVGVVLGLAALVGEQVVPILALPLASAAIGLALECVPAKRHLGRELQFAAAVATAVAFVVVAGSTRFPGSW